MVERALAPSREKAKAYIMSGDVYVNGQKEDKAGTMFQETVKIEVRGNTLPYVSRGGLKLEKAMNNFGVSLEGKVSMDVGASTGGFTDCMLQNGAVKVYSIDVGYGQLDWGLRNDPRVVCMEKTNIRYVVPEDIQEAPQFSSIDVSFISLTKVLLPVRNLLTEDGEIVCLIKPQFAPGILPDQGAGGKYRISASSQEKTGRHDLRIRTGSITGGGGAGSARSARLMTGEGRIEGWINFISLPTVTRTKTLNSQARS